MRRVVRGGVEDHIDTLQCLMQQPGIGEVTNKRRAGKRGAIKANGLMVCGNRVVDCAANPA